MNRIVSCFYLLTCIVIIFCSCSSKTYSIIEYNETLESQKEKKDYNTLAFENYYSDSDDAEKARYILNGNLIGIGNAGFLGLIHEVRNLNNNNELRVYLFSGSCKGYTPPWLWVAESSDIRKFDIVLEEKGIDLKYVRYSDTLTWKNYEYERNLNPEDAVFIFNDEEIGKGREGFLKVIEKIKMLQKGSVIGIYPKYQSERSRKLGKSYTWTSEDKELYEKNKMPFEKMEGMKELLNEVLKIYKFHCIYFSNK